MKYLKFKDIKHKFPEKSWMYSRNESNNGEFEEENILYLEGDFETENLDLDAPFVSFKDRFGNYETYLQQETCMTILIEGNLRAQNIYNDETDGSTGLVVLGDVLVQNMVVGGQDVYITGDLKVTDCFWGHYNHGDLIVEGQTDARVFVATEEYHYDYNKERTRAQHFLCDDDDEDGTFDRSVVESIFVPELLEDESEVEPDDVFSWASWLLRYAAVERLAANEPIVLKEIKILSPAEKEIEFQKSIPRQFENKFFADEAGFISQIGNFKKLMDIARSHAECDQFYEWNGFAVRVHYKSPEKNDYVMAKHPSGLQFYVQINEWEEPATGLKKIFGKSVQVEELYAMSRNNTSEDFKGIFRQEISSQNFETFQHFWTDLLTRAEIGFYVHNQFLAKVKPADLLRYLSLPVVQEKYNDYWDSDKKGFWYGNYSISARIHGVQGLEGSVDVGKEIKGDEFDMRKYFFRPDRLENPTFSELYYSPSQEDNTTDRYSGYGDIYKVYLYDWKLYREALEWYAKVEPAFEQENKSYLEEKLEETERQKKKALQKATPETVPFPEIQFAGTAFKLISRNQAQEIIGNLTDFQGEKIYDVYENTWRFPEEPNSFFLLAEEDVKVEKLELEYSTGEHPDIFILGFIFLKNLTAEKYIMAYDTDNSPALIVLGDLKASHLHLFGNVHFIGGDVHSEVIWGEYNHGELFVKGNAYAALIYENDMMLHFGGFGNVAGIVGDQIKLYCSLTDEDETPVFSEEYVLPTCQLSDIVYDNLYFRTPYGQQELYEEKDEDSALDYLLEGKSFIDESKKASFTHVDFQEIFESSVEQLMVHPSFTANNYLEWRDENALECCWIKRYEYDGVWYQQTGRMIYGDKYISATILCAEGTRDYDLNLEYFNNDMTPKFAWTNAINDENIEVAIVKFGIRKALERLVE
ncbi:hypothetical protein [Dyadobacter sp. CY312]|uniref:hypothetical protein n=1 Tax=Dyadobacter sp. CY312 TaxID=2907303 RepID=UPI001F48DE1E|nr:hypothetical protein [Dyadobacter sp. CY312]MCE7040139.1 hypothetical protein [Dyadobacter sp. CY312]